MQIAELCNTVQDNCIQRSEKIVLEWILNSAGVKFILFTSREYWNNRQQTFKIMEENPGLGSLFCTAQSSNVNQWQ